MAYDLTLDLTKNQMKKGSTDVPKLLIVLINSALIQFFEKKWMYGIVNKIKGKTSLHHETKWNTHKKLNEIQVIRNTLRAERLFFGYIHFAVDPLNQLRHPLLFRASRSRRKVSSICVHNNSNSNYKKKEKKSY